MSEFSKHLRSDKSPKPEVMQLRSEDILGEEVSIIWINLAECCVEELDSFTVQHVVGG